MRKNVRGEEHDRHPQSIMQRENLLHREKVVGGDDIIGVEGADVIEVVDLMGMRIQCHRLWGQRRWSKRGDEGLLEMSLI